MRGARPVGGCLYDLLWLPMVAPLTAPRLASTVASRDCPSGVGVIVTIVVDEWTALIMVDVQQSPLICPTAK